MDDPDNSDYDDDYDGDYYGDLDYGYLGYGGAYGGIGYYGHLSADNQAAASASAGLGSAAASSAAVASNNGLGLNGLNNGLLGVQNNLGVSSVAGASAGLGGINNLNAGASAGLRGINNFNAIQGNVVGLNANGLGNARLAGLVNNDSSAAQSYGGIGLAGGLGSVNARASTGLGGDVGNFGVVRNNVVNSLGLYEPY